MEKKQQLNEEENYLFCNYLHVKFTNISNKMYKHKCLLKIIDFNENINIVSNSNNNKNYSKTLSLESYFSKNKEFL